MNTEVSSSPSGGKTGSNTKQTVASSGSYQEQVARLSQQEKERKIWQIETENERTWGLIKDLEKVEEENTRLKVDYINAIAQNFERLYYLGKFNRPINEICSHMCELAKTKEIRASSSWIHVVCDKKYKQGQFAPNQFRPPQQADARVWDPKVDGAMLNAPATQAENLVNDSSFSPHQTSTPEPQVPEPAEPIQTWSYSASTDYIPELIPESVMRRHQQGPQKSVDEMTPDEYRTHVEQSLKDAKDKREQSREAQRRADYLLERADKLNIAIDPEVRGKIKMPTISAKSKLSGPSLFSEALKMLSEYIYRAHEKVEKYKPSEEIDQQLAEAIMLEVELWAPYVDEKWRKDQLSWFKIMIDEAAYGKHASASSNPTLLDSGIEAEVTREQVGDKRERQHRLALQIIAQMPRFQAMHKWYTETMEKAIGERKEDLHDTLSQSA